MIRKDFKSIKDSDFVEALQEDRLAYLNAMNDQFKTSKGEEAKVVDMLRDLTVLGYFTSEIGATQALTYVEVPGKFEACIPWSESDKAFAT
jgi:hypothetical protein